jgi:dUTP pyrophosphatase
MIQDNTKVLYTHNCPMQRAPSKSTEGAAGYDLRAYLPSGPVRIIPGGRALIPTGLRVAFSPEFAMLILPRSGLALKHGISVLNAPGLVDSDYRGDVCVLLVNHSDKLYTVNDGDRIAQALFVKPAALTWSADFGVEDLHSARGASGFGSTGLA